jgi:hypothetical protein
MLRNSLLHYGSPIPYCVLTTYKIKIILIQKIQWVFLGWKCKILLLVHYYKFKQIIFCIHNEKFMHDFANYIGLIYSLSAIRLL